MDRLRALAHIVGRPWSVHLRPGRVDEAVGITQEQVIAGQLVVEWEPYVGEGPDVFASSTEEHALGIDETGPSIDEP